MIKFLLKQSHSLRSRDQIAIHFQFCTLRSSDNRLNGMKNAKIIEIVCESLMRKIHIKFDIQILTFSTAWESHDGNRWAEKQLHVGELMRFPFLAATLTFLRIFYFVFIEATVRFLVAVGTVRDSR